METPQAARRADRVARAFYLAAGAYAAGSLFLFGGLAGLLGAALTGGNFGAVVAAVSPLVVLSMTMNGKQADADAEIILHDEALRAARPARPAPAP